MATGATIFKAELQIADLDRNYYHDHALTLARHPSETDERMMVRLLAFVLHAHETLSFGNGLSTCDEPDLWQKDLTGAIQFWIDVGLPDEKTDPQSLWSCQAGIHLYVWWPSRRYVVEPMLRQTRTDQEPGCDQFTKGSQPGHRKAGAAQHAFELHHTGWANLAG